MVDILNEQIAGLPTNLPNINLPAIPFPGDDTNVPDGVPLEITIPAPPQSNQPQGITTFEQARALNPTRTNIPQVNSVEELFAPQVESTEDTTFGIELPDIDEVIPNILGILRKAGLNAPTPEQLAAGAQFLVEIVGPQADINDLVTFSRAGSDKILNGDISGGIADLLMSMASVAFIAIPGSVGGIKKGSDALVQKFSVEEVERLSEISKRKINNGQAEAIEISDLPPLERIAILKRNEQLTDQGIKTYVNRIDVASVKLPNGRIVPITSIDGVLSTISDLLSSQPAMQELGQLFFLNKPFRNELLNNEKTIGEFYEEINNIGTKMLSDGKTWRDLDSEELVELTEALNKLSDTLVKSAKEFVTVRKVPKGKITVPTDKKPFREPTPIEEGFEQGGRVSDPLGVVSEQRINAPSASRLSNLPTVETIERLLARTVEELKAPKAPRAKSSAGRQNQGGASNAAGEVITDSVAREKAILDVDPDVSANKDLLDDIDADLKLQDADINVGDVLTDDADGVLNRFDFDTLRNKTPEQIEESVLNVLNLKELKDNKILPRLLNTRSRLMAELSSGDGTDETVKQVLAQVDAFIEQHETFVDVIGIIIKANKKALRKTITQKKSTLSATPLKIIQEARGNLEAVTEIDLDIAVSHLIKVEQRIEDLSRSGSITQLKTEIKKLRNFLNELPIDLDDFGDELIKNATDAIKRQTGTTVKTLTTDERNKLLQELQDL